MPLTTYKKEFKSNPAQLSIKIMPIKKLKDKG